MITIIKAMISGRSFSDHCKWVVDPRYPERKKFNYDNAADGDWVFLNGDYINDYVSLVPPVHNKFFNIIVHNSDRPFTHRVMRGIPAVAHVYAINTTFSHPRLTTIPIGFVDRQLPFLQTLSPSSRDRDIEIYCNFTIDTNRVVRKKCIESFIGDPRVFYRSNVPVSDYYNDLLRSKYVLCPEGEGIDTHRVYESILCGATPVVLQNSLSHLYEKLPVCIVENWSDPFYIPVNKTFPMDVVDYIK